MLGKGKISESELQEIKKAFPDTPLFMWNSRDKKHEAVFRPISHELLDRVYDEVEEAKTRGTKLTDNDINERFFDDCVLWPALNLEDKLNLVVGAIPAVARAIKERSGFVDVDIFGNPTGPDVVTVVIKDYDYWPDYTEKEKQELKAVSPFQLYRARIGGWYFIIRPMTRADQKAAQEPGVDSALELAQHCTVWPKTCPWELLPAGDVDTLSQVIIRISGYDRGDSVDVVEI